jgi:hypothetical protein
MRVTVAARSIRLAATVSVHPPWGIWARVRYEGRPSAPRHHFRTSVSIAAADLALTWNTARTCQPSRRCCASRRPDTSAMPTFAAPSSAWVIRYTSAAPSPAGASGTASGPRRRRWSASRRARAASHRLIVSSLRTALTAARAASWRAPGSSGGRLSHSSNPAAWLKPSSAVSATSTYRRPVDAPPISM